MNRDSLSDESSSSSYARNRLRWIVLIVLMVGGTLWSLMRFEVRKPGDSELPPKPWTKADLPALRRNLNSLKEDAGVLDHRIAALHRSPQGKVERKVREEIFYTPELYPAFVQYRGVERAHILELQPNLASYCRLVTDYEEARHAIATDTGTGDKAAALAALDRRFQPQFKTPGYATNRKAFDAARLESFGDPEFDQAAETYRRACSKAILQHHPELADYFHELEVCSAAHAALTGKANALSREIRALENNP